MQVLSLWTRLGKITGVGWDEERESSFQKEGGENAKRRGCEYVYVRINLKMVHVGFLEFPEDQFRRKDSTTCK